MLAQVRLNALAPCYVHDYGNRTWNMGDIRINVIETKHLQ